VNYRMEVLKIFFLNCVFVRPIWKSLLENMGIQSWPCD